MRKWHYVLNMDEKTIGLGHIYPHHFKHDKPLFDALNEKMEQIKGEVDD